MASNRTWITRGFEAFRAGTFGGSGQNVYVSRQGVLQRIFHFDFNRDGYADVVFANSQDHCENPPSYVYRDPLGRAERIEIPSDGAWSGICADLNGDGYDDLVIGMYYDGVLMQLNARIFYGSAEGFSEKRMQLVPAPACTSVAAGDFNGDGQCDLAFVCRPVQPQVIRLFYQTPLSFEPERFVDLDIPADQIAAADLDRDGYTDLIVRREDGTTRIYWGSPHGIDPGRFSELPLPPATPAGRQDLPETEYAEYTPDAVGLPKGILLQEQPCVFCPQPDRVLLVPVKSNRTFGPPIELHARHALAVAVGDLRGSGRQDLVLACRDRHEGRECSWIYWGGPEGFSENNRHPLVSHRACDVALGDLAESGGKDVVLCQCHTYDSFTHDSLIYRLTPEGVSPVPVRLAGEDARRVAVPQGPKDRRPPVILVNHFSRAKTGSRTSTIYFGGPEGFSPDRKCDLYAAGAVESFGCDLNDDGLADLVFANASENAISRDPGSFVYFGRPEGFADQPDLIFPTTRAHGVVCGDLNRDGYLDLAFVGFDNPELLVFYGGPNGFDLSHPHRLRLERDGVVYKEPRWISLVDVNRDGWLDLIVPDMGADRSLILWGGPEGFSLARCQVLSVQNGGCVEAADLTGNGYPDLIFGCARTHAGLPHRSWLYIYWNGPEGIREDRRMQLPGDHANAVTLADFNGDGRLDLFACSYHDGLKRDVDSYIYWNRPGRGFSEKDRTGLRTHSASGCLAADFNEDGYIDLAVANHKVYGDHRGFSEIWWNGPTGFSKERTTRLPTFGPHGICRIPTGNPLDRGPEEYYTSPPWKLPEGRCVTAVDWQADTPPKTWVRAQVRFASTPEKLELAAWRGPDNGAGWYEKGQTVEAAPFPGQWVQYRLALGAVNGGATPRITEVRVTTA